MTVSVENASVLENLKTFETWQKDYYEPTAIRHYDRAIARMLSVLKPSPGSTVLDAGCGTGVHSIRVAKAGFNVKAIDISDAVLTARRECDDGFEVYRLGLPAVVGVKEGINLPRYPTLPGRLRSKKAEVQTIVAEPPGGGLNMVRFETPAVEVTETVLLGTGAGAAGAVVDLFYELGLA